MKQKLTAELALVNMVESALATAVTEYWKNPAERSMTKQELNLVISRAQMGMDYLQKLGLELTNYEDLLAGFDHDAKIIEVRRHGGKVKTWLQTAFATVKAGPYGALHAHEPLV